ncbi:hypothetical protein AAVH_35338 [Aphelenchoides avenae]|nr:hypothetical protein AAVH_35338 [Aphelenchus avenae]
MEVIMIGEFGLEFGVSQEEKAKPFPGEVSKAQKDLFMAHVQVANETGLPIMLHIRGRTFRMQQDLERLAIRYLQEGGFTNQVPIIRHSYAGGAGVAQEWVDAFDKTYFSYGPVSRSWGQAAAGMDNFDPGLIRSLVETDCPLQERDEEENKNLPPNSPLRVPSHPDTTLKMLNHLCAARKIDLDDGARAVAAATMRAFSIGQDAIMAALTCPVVVPADSVANRDHEAAFPGHKPKFSDEGGQKQSQKGLGPKPTKQAITKQQLKSALLFAAAGGPRGTATRPNTNADDDGRDFGDATHTKSTNSNVKRSKTRRGDSPPPATGNDDVAAVPRHHQATPHSSDHARPGRDDPFGDLPPGTPPGRDQQTVGSQVRSLNRDVIAKIKSHTTRELAKEVAERFIPSIFHSILIHYLKHLPEDLGASKYQIMKKVLNQDVDYLLGEIEVILGQLIQRGACNPQKLSDTMVHQGVHSWTFCCRYPYNSCQHRKTVGPIRYEQTSRRELSEFGEDLLEFILHHIPDGIDHNRMHRQGDRQVLIKERIVFIGDSVAASLASRTRDRNATYVEVYTLKELAKFLNVAYFGCDVLQVIIAVGRTDMARLRVNRGVGEMRFYMEHVLIALARNFPHVRFTFVGPPYTHTQRQKWEEQVRCLPALPRLFRSLFDRCSNAFDDAQDWMDCEGNLRWGGLTNVIRHLHTNLRVEVFELDPKADGAPLVPPSWRVADFTRGPPAEQQNAPVGKADIQYLSEDELPLRKFRMRPPGPSDEREERSPSQTGSTMSRRQMGDHPTTSRTRSSSRSSNVFDTRVSQTSVETGSATHTPDPPVLGGTQYRMPYYQVAPQTTATPPTQAAQGQPTQALSASFTAAPAPDYIPSPLHQYGYGTSYGQSTYFPSPLHQQAGVSQGQQTHQAQQPMQTNPPPGFAPPPSAYIPPPPPGLGNLFRPPATFGQSMTAPQTSSAITGQPMAPQTHTFSGNAGQPMAPQAQTVGVQGSGAGYSAFQVHPSFYSQVHALQSQPQQSQTPGSDGYHSLPHTAPASSSQTPAPQQQPQPPTSTAPIGGQYTLTPEMVEALLKAGYNIPPRQ